MGGIGGIGRLGWGGGSGLRHTRIAEDGSSRGGSPPVPDDPDGEVASKLEEVDTGGVGVNDGIGGIPVESAGDVAGSAKPLQSPAGSKRILQLKSLMPGGTKKGDERSAEQPVPDSGLRRGKGWDRESMLQDEDAAD